MADHQFRAEATRISKGNTQIIHLHIIFNILFYRPLGMYKSTSPLQASQLVVIEPGVTCEKIAHHGIMIENQFRQLAHLKYHGLSGIVPSLK